MTLLRSIERRIERIVEGAFGRMFRGHVQPAELARRLVKDMDGHQTTTMRSVFVPNRYEVYLSTSDFERLSDLANALTNELSEYLAEHARRSGYSLHDRPRVEIRLDERLALGEFGIATRMADPAAAHEAASVTPSVEAAPAPVQPTSVLRKVIVPAQLIGETQSHPLAPDAVTTLGRGPANDIVLDDSSVSRDHAEVIVRDGNYVIRDCGSTNGVLVNGEKITERTLAAGDLVTVGTSTLRMSIGQAP